MRLVIITLFFTIIHQYSLCQENRTLKISVIHCDGSEQIKDDSLKNESNLKSLGGGMVNDHHKNKIIYSLSYYSDTIKKTLNIYLMKTDTSLIQLKNSWVSTDCIIVKGLTIKDIHSATGYSCIGEKNQLVHGIVYYDDDLILKAYKLFYIDEKKERIKWYTKNVSNCGLLYIH